MVVCWVTAAEKARKGSIFWLISRKEKGLMEYVSVEFTNGRHFGRVNGVVLRRVDGGGL